MAAEPVEDPDQLCSTLELRNENIKRFKGQTSLHYGAVRTTKERTDKAAPEMRIMQTIPSKPEHQNWQLKPREKHREIGPQFRHDDQLQVQRLMKHLSSNTSQFTIGEVNGRAPRRDMKSFNSRATMDSFLRSGEYKHRLNVDPEHFDDPDEYQDALKRDTKLQQTNYLIPPDKMLQSLHTKTHFKASQGIAQDVLSLKITSRMYNEEFINAKAHLQTRVTAKTPMAFKSQPTLAVEDLVSSDGEREDQRLKDLKTLENA